MRRLLLLLAFVAGCGSDSTGPASVTVTGSYTLQRVNGAALPFILSQTTTSKDEVTSGSITLNADGTFSNLFGVRSTSGATVTTTSVALIGVYQNTNAQVEFTPTTPAGLARFNGSVSGSTLTIVQNGGSFVYGR